MNVFERLEALRTANRRTEAGFAESVESVADAVRAEIATIAVDAPASRAYPHRRLVPISVAGAESGFKEGHPIRVLPFGYVAHDEAADPAAPLDVDVTVGADGVVREIAVTWG
jgi:hypothetical protein